jgi:hypothetical protein
MATTMMPKVSRQEQATRASEILNAAIVGRPQELLLAVEKCPEGVNYRGHAGDNALHIAAFQKNCEMMIVLLDHAADPNHKNTKGDTSFHISCRLGDINGLKTLYASTRCDLLLVNNDQDTAYNVANKVVNMEDVDLLHHYADWTASFNNILELEKMKAGRAECSRFLADKLTVDYDKRRLNSIRMMQTTNIEYSKSTNIIRGKGHFDDRVFKSDLNYAASIAHIAPHEIDYTRLKNDAEATEEAVTTTDLAERLLRSGIYGTSLAAQVGKLKALTATRTDLLDSFEDEEERVEER